MNLLSRFWRKLRLLYLLLLPVRFSILALAVAAFAFTLSDQGRDIIRALSEVDPVLHRAHWGRIAVFLLLLNVLAYQIWFWSRQMLRVEPPPPGPDDRLFGRAPDPQEAEHRGFAMWLPRVLAVLLFIALGFAFWNVRETYDDDVQTVTPIIVGLIALSLAAFLVLVILRRRWLERRRDGGGHIGHVPPRALAKSTRLILGAFLLLAVVFFIASTINPTGLMGLGAGALVLLVLSLWVPFGSVIVYAGMRMRIPILTFLVLEALLVSPLADRNHVVRTVASPANIDARPTVDEKLMEWYGRVAPQYPAGADIPVFIVATEGGGIRAAYWTAAVLDSLQDTNPLFRRNLFAISGVSGGSLGTLTFTSLLAEPSLRAPMHATGSQALSSDFLTPTLAALSQSDLLQRFLPFGFPDRERALEEGWEVGYRDVVKQPTFARGLLELYSRNRELPSVFINGTMVETGDRVITSNCRIRPRAGGGVTPLLVFRNAFDGFELLGRDLPMSAAAGMSARFTYVSPGGRIPKRDGKLLAHVVDGGYFENSGAVTAAELVTLVNVVARRQQWRLVPVVILIDYEQCPACPDPYGPFAFGDRPDNPLKADRWAAEVLSPLRALLDTRGARGDQAVGDVRTEATFVDALRVGSKLPSVIEFRLVQRQVPMPLGWVLSVQARHAIDGAVESNGNRWARNTVAQWLLTAAPPPDDMAVQSNARLATVTQ
ncbi:MAG TPA: hypothetical protein VF698_16550 [Thermoanaerobaculia bacterium]